MELKFDYGDHLLLTIYENYKWGNPFALDSHNEENIKDLVERGLAKYMYYQKPELSEANEPCSFDCGEIRDCPENIFDLLGMYIVEDPAKEGKIVLFEDCILKFATQFYDRIGGPVLHVPLQECITMVHDIVLWHELGHWITHWMPDHEGNRWNSKLYILSNDDVNNLHEGVAQLFTCYAMIQYKDNPARRTNLMLVFEYMLGGQASCYRRHLDILGHKNFSWQGCFNALQAMRKEQNPENLNLEALLSRLNFL